MSRMPWQPLPLDTPIDAVSAMLILQGTSALVATRSPALLPGSAWTKDLLRVVQWRNSGPLPRKLIREVSRNATVESVAIAQELHPERAFRLAGVRWPAFRPPLVQASPTMQPITVAEALTLLPPFRGPRHRAEAQIAEVRQLYGRMLADIAYRIENSALFDSSVPLTRQFDTALALWAEVTDATPEAEVVRRASLVKVTFDAARANAETLGMAHLPRTARDPARRAAGVARLAAGTAIEAERQAAMAQVVQILSSLALYYLPSPDDLPKAITDRRRGSSRG